jgi:SpoVK/Ycf46/Vps4 family AAA+-type ATPase
LIADLRRVLASCGPEEADERLRVLFRDATFREAVLFLEQADVALGETPELAYGIFFDYMRRHGGVVLMSGERPWDRSGRAPEGVVALPFATPDPLTRRTMWRSNIDRPDDEIETVASRFKLSAAQIEDAAAIANWTGESLFASARLQNTGALAGLAQKIEPSHGWDDLVLPEDAIGQLHEICERVRHRERVFGDWGFDGKLSLGKGVNALFAGPPGTGKTMAAEVVARELGLDLYRVNLAGVVSKYIGETEKNLDRIFTAAAHSNAILLFDEADALFGKRSEVRDSHDRYANIEVSYLLQKMEEYDGVALLATNLRANLDDAFVRRLAFTILFPFPDELNRARIWQGIWPHETPLAADVDAGRLAGMYRVSGGNIKNIALAAAFLAAGDGGVVRMSHVLRAVRREYQKLGKTLEQSSGKN